MIVRPSNVISPLVLLPLLLLVGHLVDRTAAAPPPAGARPQPASLEPNPGLYADGGDVDKLTANNFQAAVFNREHGTLVEFYNAFCGFCKRFAPHWVEFAADVRDWRPVVRVAAIDCANELNTPLCREYEIMAYPTLRYFGARFADAKSYGQPLNQTALPELRAQLAAAVRNQSATAQPDGWSQLDAAEQPLANLLGSAPPGVRLTFVVYEPADSWVANELALDFYANGRVRVQRVHSAPVAATYGLKRKGTAALVTAQGEVVPLTLPTFDRESLRTAIRRFVREHGLEVETMEAVVGSSVSSVDEASRAAAEAKHLQELMLYVKRNEPTVYLADIEHTVWYALGHEVPQFAVIGGDRLEALKRFVAVLSKYVPLTASGSELLRELDVFVSSATELRGETFQSKLVALKHKWEITNFTDPAALSWIGCHGSTANRRGYTCGLWWLFHFITVQAVQRADIAANATPYVDAVDPLEVLQAIHGYVRYFFGCTDCSQHFQRMAIERQAWQVRTPSEAVLWLWRAHNEVNARLASDPSTNDPLFAKQAYPREGECPRCRNGSGSLTNASLVQWVDDAVLPHLMQVYAVQNLSYYGVATVGPVMPSAQPLVSSRRMLDSVFSDLDMRMGILLYVFCIGMIGAAVYLFVRQRSGYRRKMYYTRELMGKV